jgi:hypothetical protein
VVGAHLRRAAAGRARAYVGGTYLLVKGLDPNQAARVARQLSNGFGRIAAKHVTSKEPADEPRQAA